MYQTKIIDGDFAPLPEHLNLFAYPPQFRAVRKGGPPGSTLSTCGPPARRARMPANTSDNSDAILVTHDFRIVESQPLCIWPLLWAPHSAQLSRQIHRMRFRVSLHKRRLVKVNDIKSADGGRSGRIFLACSPRTHISASPFFANKKETAGADQFRMESKNSNGASWTWHNIVLLAYILEEICSQQEGKFSR